MTAENAPRFAEDLCLSPPPPAPARLFLPSGVLSIASLGSFSVSGVCLHRCCPAHALCWVRLWSAPARDLEARQGHSGRFFLAGPRFGCPARVPLVGHAWPDPALLLRLASLCCVPGCDPGSLSATRALKREQPAWRREPKVCNTTWEGGWGCWYRMSSLNGWHSTKGWEQSKTPEVGGWWWWRGHS